MICELHNNPDIQRTNYISIHIDTQNFLLLNKYPDILLAHATYIH